MVEVRPTSTTIQVSNPGVRPAPENPSSTTPTPAPEKQKEGDTFGNGEPPSVTQGLDRNPPPPSKTDVKPKSKEEDGTQADPAGTEPKKAPVPRTSLLGASPDGDVRYKVYSHLPAVNNATVNNALVDLRDGTSNTYNVKADAKEGDAPIRQVLQTEKEDFVNLYGAGWMDAGTFIDKQSGVEGRLYSNASGNRILISGEGKVEKNKAGEPVAAPTDQKAPTVQNEVLGIGYTRYAQMSNAGTHKATVDNAYVDLAADKPGSTTRATQYEFAADKKIRQIVNGDENDTITLTGTWAPGDTNYTDGRTGKTGRLFTNAAGGKVLITGDPGLVFDRLTPESIVHINQDPAQVQAMY